VLSPQHNESLVNVKLSKNISYIVILFSLAQLHLISEEAEGEGVTFQGHPGPEVKGAKPQSLARPQTPGVFLLRLGAGGLPTYNPS
jgi:hypothetical protein